MRSALSAGSQGGRSLDASKIEAAYVGFHKTFNGRIGHAESIHQRIATVVTTTDLVDRQVWLGATPKMRRWIGDKVLNKLRAESHPIVTGPYEASLEIPKHDLLNDKLSLYVPKINALADAYSWALDELAIGMLCAGVAGTSLGTTYDGQNLIDTDHTASSAGGTSQTNHVAGAFSASTYNEAFTKLLKLKDENGIPANVAGRRMTLLVGPAWREVARDILDQQTQSSGESNMDRGTSDLIVTQWLTAGTIKVNGVSVTITGTEWFLLPSDSTAVLIHVKRTPEFLRVEDGEYAFRTGKYLYGIEAEFGAAYGLWQEIAGGPGA